MNKYLFLLILTIHSISSFAQTNWILKETHAGYWLWKDIASNTRLTKNIETTKNLVTLDKNYYKKIEKEKQELLKHVGISNWSVFDYKVNNNQISFYGTYTDRKNKLVYFQEIHISEGLALTQFLFTSNNKISNPKKNKLAILKEFLN